jgi:uncharacterized protein YfaS (alpha-2-macroglobulin family)
MLKTQPYCRFSLLFVFLFLAGILFAAENNPTPFSYEDHWKKVAQLNKEVLPESALKEVDTLLLQAKKEKNTVQFIKASVQAMVYHLQLDPEKAPTEINAFESLTNQTSDATDKALLQSMTAELYLMYYKTNYYTVNQRTDLVGKPSSDVREWTKNQFTEKIIQLLNGSLQNGDLLQKKDIQPYVTLLKEQKNALPPANLFELLIQRKIGLLYDLRNRSQVKNPTLDAAQLLQPLDAFKVLKLDSAQLSVLDFVLLSSFQQGLRYAEQPAHQNTLIAMDLYRLKTCLSILESNRYIVLFGDAGKQITYLEQKYLQAVHALVETFSQKEEVLDALEKEASFYFDHFLPKDSVQKNYLRKAFDLTANGIAHFPNSERLGALRNLQERIRQVKISANNKEVAKPNSKLNIEVQTFNVDTLILNVYRVEATALEYLRQNKNAIEPFPKTLWLEKRVIVIKNDSNFTATASSISIKTGTYGIYEFTLEKPGRSELAFRCSFVVSDMDFMMQVGNTTQLQVVDRVSGKPCSKVGIDLYSQEWVQNKIQINPYIINGETDKTGLYTIYPKKFNQNVYIVLKRGADQYLTTQNFLNKNYYNREEDKRLKINIFTDRAVYRPGQTVYFKGIAYYSNSEKQEVLSGRTFDVQLVGANQKIVAVKTMMTNDFGSFTDSFVLPENGLNGAYSLRCNDYSEFFRVEAYKRPTFEVTLQRPKMEAHFGEPMTVEGKVAAYAGFPMSGATVTYRVIQRAHRLWASNVRDFEMLNGVAKTSVDGTFQVTFQAERNQTIQGDQFYTYEVIATAIDSKGETQEGKRTVSVGDKSLFILNNLLWKAKINKDSAQAFDIRVETLNGERVDTSLRYELYRLKPCKTLNAFAERDYVPERAELVRSGIHSTKDGLWHIDLKTLESGAYQLVWTTEDSRHQKVVQSTELMLFSLRDKRPPVSQYVWSVTDKSACMPGEKAHIQFGTSARNVHVLYQLMKADTVFERRWIHLSNEMKNMDIPFKSSYGGGVNVQFSFIKDEQLFTTTVPISLKVVARTLKPTWSVFRDKLLPGEKAEWSLSIPELKDQKKIAELLVYMYDASLNAVQPQSIWFAPAYRLIFEHSPNWTSTVANQRQKTKRFNVETFPEYRPTVQDLDWMNLNFNKGQLNVLREVRIAGASSISDAMQGRVAGLDIANLEDHRVVVEEKPVYGSLTIGKTTTISVATVKGAEEAEPAITLRRNFNETAFFYPRLHTDVQGNVSFSFTVPESLTRWNVNVLAHTKDLYSGILTDQTVTQKDLMVQLNLPRFVRSSDKLQLRASVVNLTDSCQKVQVKLELFDPKNDQSIPLKDGLSKTVLLAPKESKAVEWALTEFAPYELVACKVVAWNKLFSDGEQRYLPVLPDCELITETLPMTVRAGKSKTFELENLLESKSTVQTQALTVEFSPNPVWYAIQALPTISAPQSENALDYFTAYYANTLANHIVRSNPKIQAVFEQWKAVGGSRDALLSNLEKNQELKTLLLEETPWVVAAQNETEQMKRIALLFDLNQQRQQNEQYWNKMLKFQQPSGGFSWYDGMYANRYVTQLILLNQARLSTMLHTDATPIDAAMLKAIGYIDNELSHDYADLKKYDLKYQTTMTIGDMQWFYLHVRSHYPQVPIPDFAREAVTYYKKQAQTYWQEATLYGKAATALIAARDSNQLLASKILLSLKENALKSEDMGMYWARNTAGYGWNQRPVMVQTMMLEAFAEIARNTDDLDELKIWLLRQKQTQRWDSPLSTVDAIYALMCKGSDWLSSDNHVVLQLGDKKVETATDKAGTGYVKQTFAAQETTPSMGHVQATLMGSSGFGWGALYWQYYQPLQEVKQSGNALNVSKMLYIERMQPTGKTLIPISKAVLKKGDKVTIRLVVNVDRDLEYVALKDLRAACFEPVEQRSGCVWREGVAYYQTTKDASTQFFFSLLPKGTYVFEYEVLVNNAGEFTSGITTLQCQYAPEFSAHSGGERISVSEL